MAVLGSELNIYTGWDFVDEINPSSIFSFGWYDEESTLTGNPYDVYFAGWNDYTNNIKVFESGWFSEEIPNTTTSGMPYDVYFSNWNNPSDVYGIFNSGWFDSISSATNVNISLNKLDYNFTIQNPRIVINKVNNTNPLQINFTLNSPSYTGNQSVTINLNKLDYNFILKSVKRAGEGFTEVNLNPLQMNFILRKLKNVIASGEFLSFINREDVRNIVINVDNKKGSILFEPENEDSIDFFNTGVW